MKFGKKVLTSLVLSVGLSISASPVTQAINTGQIGKNTITPLSRLEQTINQNTIDEETLKALMAAEPYVQQEYLELIYEKTEKYKHIYDVDPLFILALLKAETGSFNPNAISPAAAAGLAQIIPETASLYSIKTYNPSYLAQARKDLRESYKYRRNILNDLSTKDNASGYKTRTIKEGDTLGKIAKEEGISLDKIVEENDIEDPNKIYKGQQIIIPKPGNKNPGKFYEENKKLYQHYKQKGRDGFKKYKEELKAMTNGKTEAELMNIDQRFVPEIAIDFCAQHMAELLATRNGDLREAASAYNAGLGAVKKYGGVPAYTETVKYQNKVFNKYKKYKKAVDSIKKDENNGTTEFSN